MPRRTPFEKAMHEMLFGEIKKERVPLPIKTRREVYEKAHKRCQCCGRHLKINQGVFHHLRKTHCEIKTVNRTVLMFDRS